MVRYTNELELQEILMTSLLSIHIPFLTIICRKYEMRSIRNEIVVYVLCVCVRHHCLRRRKERVSVIFYLCSQLSENDSIIVIFETGFLLVIVFWTVCCALLLTSEIERGGEKTCVRLFVPVFVCAASLLCYVLAIAFRSSFWILRVQNEVFCAMIPPNKSSVCLSVFFDRYPCGMDRLRLLHLLRIFWECHILRGGCISRMMKGMI